MSTLEKTSKSLLTPRQVADILPISHSLIYSFGVKGVIPSIRIGKRLFFQREVIERVLREGTEIPQPTPVISTSQNKENA
jgi:predicted DNA-binding transcriptional regulator AlpA